MSRDVRYYCLTHGPFLFACDIGPDRKAPLWRRCPVSGCGWKSRRVHRRKPSGHSVSVRGEVFERLQAEAERRGTTMRALVEAATKECK